MSKLAKSAIAAALLLALTACQSGVVEQQSIPSDGAVPAEGSPPADGSEYPAPELLPDAAYPSPS